MRAARMKHAASALGGMREDAQRRRTDDVQHLHQGPHAGTHEHSHVGRGTQHIELRRRKYRSLVMDSRSPICIDVQDRMVAASIDRDLPVEG